MLGTRDLFHKSEEIHKAAHHFLEKDVDKLLDLIKSKASSDEELRKKAREIVKEMHEKHSQVFYLQRLYQQAKQMSQIIVYIWRWADADGAPQQHSANELKKYFTNPTGDDTKPAEHLKELLKANPKNADHSKPAKLLKDVFFEKEPETSHNLLFPMFDEFELGESKFKYLGYLFQITVNSFQGTIGDSTKNMPELMKFSIPYPPCPAIGNATVTYNEMENWIANRKEDEYFSDNIYIPTSSS